MTAPYTYSNLVSYYWDEARRSLANELHVAAIALSWAAVDYAIEFELHGGSKLSPKSLRPRSPIRFNPSDVRGKIDHLICLFPELADWREKLLFLYDGYRNTFLHAKLGNFQEVSLADGTDSSARLVVLTSSKSPKNNRPVGACSTLWSVMSEADTDARQHIRREMHVIGQARASAAAAHHSAKGFLADLNRAVSKATVPETPD